MVRDANGGNVLCGGQIEVSQGRKAVVIFVPHPLLKGFNKVQQRYVERPNRHISHHLPPLTNPISLTRELEKKFSDRHVVFIAQRRILPLPGRRSRVQQKRPRNRTLTAVHDAILGDLVYPTEIVGKRVRTKEDGHKVIKVFLDAKDRAAVDYKVDTFGEVYRKLTGKSVVFEFPAVSGEGY
jgi:small subunit ribosomal protein S7e